MMVYNFIADYIDRNGIDRHGPFQMPMFQSQNPYEAAEYLLKYLIENGAEPRAIFWIPGTHTMQELVTVGDSPSAEMRKKIKPLWVSNKVFKEAAARFKSR